MKPTKASLDPEYHALFEFDVLMESKNLKVLLIIFILRGKDLPRDRDWYRNSELFLLICVM